MKIGLASDHRGINLKNKIKKYLESKNYEIIDYGTDTEENVDYTKYAFILGESIKDKQIDLGIAICGTGIGMSIALNKVKNVMCAKISNKEEAYYAKKHNNANVIALSSKINIIKIKKMIEIFLNTPYEKEKKYQKRINDIKKYEEEDK